MGKTKYPAWRRSLDIYKAWFTNKVSDAELAKRFKTDGKSIHNSVTMIGDLLYTTGRRQRTFAELEALFVMVAKFAPENDVVKIVRVLVGWFPTVGEFFEYDDPWEDIPGVGPKYADILAKVQANSVKDIHVRISYQAYLKLREYCYHENKTFSAAVEDFINK